MDEYAAGTNQLWRFQLGTCVEFTDDTTEWALEMLIWHFKLHHRLQTDQMSDTHE